MALLTGTLVGEAAADAASLVMGQAAAQAAALRLRLTQATTWCCPVPARPWRVSQRPMAPRPQRLRPLPRALTRPLPPQPPQ